MTELSQISHQQKRDDLSEAEVKWQQVARIEEGAISGSEVHYYMCGDDVNVASAASEQQP